MIEALLARPKTVDFRGEPVVLRRPTVADLVAALDASTRGDRMEPWYVANHVLGPDGRLLYTIEEAQKLSAPACIALARIIEPLYTEGLD